MSVLMKRMTVAAIAATGALLLLAPTSQAATSFGSLRTTNGPTEEPCNDNPIIAPCSIVQFIVPTNPNGDPYSGGAPVDGVITKFRIRAFGGGVGMGSATPAQVTFGLANITQQNPGNATATLAATGPTVTVPPDDGSGQPPVTQAAARVTVSKGQQLAISASQNILATYNSSGSKFSYVFAPPLAVGQPIRGSVEAAGELLVSADIEPDADHDGFGDETQDQCPTQATTQGPCNTTVPALSSFKVANGKISYTLSEAATVKLTLAKATTGRKVNGVCVRKTRRNSGRRHCTRFVQV
ncbi:MAG TPA: hypothetical protein VGI67_22050, partial [Thermoleophilaceae bacterium]